MKLLITALVSVAAAGSAFAGGGKPIPGIQHDPPRFLDESRSWIGALGQGDEGYRFQAGLVVENWSESDRVRIDWTQGGKVLGTAKCRVGNTENHDTVGVLNCEYSDKPIKAKGAIEAHVIYEDDKDDKQYLVRTFKFEMKQWDKVTWQIAADDLLYSAYMWHGAVGQQEKALVFRFWIANSGNFNSTLRCNAAGEKLHDFDSETNDNAGALEADIIPPKGERQTWRWTHYDYVPAHLKWGMRPADDKDASVIYLGDHPGDWDCQIRKDGIAIRQLLFHVNDKGRVDSHPMQQAKDAYPLAPNVALVDIRVPAGNGLDMRIKPDALRKSRAFGLPWPSDPSVKTVLGAIPAAYENAHPVAVKAKGGGKLLDGSAHSPPVYIDESTTEIRLTNDSKGYNFHLFAQVYGASNEKSDQYRLDWTQGGKTLATVKCDWGHDRGDKGEPLVPVTCDDRDTPLNAKGEIAAKLVYHDDEDGNDYLVRTYKANVAKFTSFGGTIWQVVPDDQLAQVWATTSGGDPMDVYGQRLFFRFWIAGTFEGSTPDLTVRCTVDGTKIPDIKATAERTPGGFEVKADPYTKDGKHTTYQWTHVSLETEMYHGKKDRKDINEESKKAHGIMGEHPGKWDCVFRHEGKVVRQVMFAVGDDGEIIPDELATGKGAPKTPANVVAIETRFPKEVWDQRIRPDAMKKSRGYGLPWPEAPGAKGAQATYGGATGLPDPR
jgi:hypothetical protein